MLAPTAKPPRRLASSGGVAHWLGVDVTDLTRIVPLVDTTDMHERPHYDNCPECCARSNRPTRTRPSGPGCRATYVCHTCGHNWWTAFACSEVAG